jgi:GNAT superfamily N-acetyltransferase
VDTLDRMLRTMSDAWAAMAGDARWTVRDGVGALVTPYVPQRSVVNSVVYQPGSDIAAAYDWLSAEYARVSAWTVWVPESDRETAALLESRGHKLDANPATMALDLAAFDPPAQLPDWRPATLEELARINEAAYPWRDGSMEQALLRSGADAFRLYIAEDASVLGVGDCDRDAGVFFVATLPEARGRGLAGGLLAAAMVDARDRGCDISTLQATKVGESVYARLGYQRFGAIQMWEKRTA